MKPLKDNTIFLKYVRAPEATVHASVKITDKRNENNDKEEGERVKKFLHPVVKAAINHFSVEANGE